MNGCEYGRESHERRENTDVQREEKKRGKGGSEQQTLKKTGVGAKSITEGRQRDKETNEERKMKTYCSRKRK